MKGAKRIRGIISSRSKQLTLWGPLDLKNLQKMCRTQCGVGESFETDKNGQ